MKCTKCGAENRKERKFCAECGAKLGWVCPQCGFENEPDERFCGGCGHPFDSELAGRSTPAEVSPPATIPKLEDMHAQLQSLIPDALAQKYLAAEQQATGENRPITALFADISGFTPLSATQSSETMFQLVQDCFKRLVSIVANYEGSISGFRGDGLLALFGAPILHENDAERAVLAALDMRGSIQDRQLEVSIGINTAMMTVGEIQTQLHKEYTAYGTDINLAKRLQEAAEPGQILVGSGTHRLTRRAFDFETISSLSLKGFTQPVTAYSVQQVKTHPEKLRGIEGLRARMIGREHEFAELKDAADAWLGGQGQMVSIIGEAGIGKSRLVKELREYLDMRLETSDMRQESLKSHVSSLMSILEGRCVSIGQPISYWPFLDILRSWFGLSEEDSEAERAQKVKEHVRSLLPGQSDDVLPFLGHLMNLRFGGDLDTRLEHYSAEQIKYQTMMRLRDLLVALARQERLMLVLEDLHWADDLSLDLLSLLMDELMAHPLMLVCVYRPEREHRVWRLGSMAQRKCLERYTEISLQKLHPRESRRLVQELLAIDNLSESVRGVILSKSEGNPFFIEEVIRSLMERGLVYREDDRWKAREDIVGLEVPDTIQSVVLARVDRLEAEAKHVLQCASVIGRLFKHRLLEHLTQKQQELDRYITEFEERDLVYEERTVPELEYAFKHALTQEATYQGILEQRRRVFHREVAQGIERLYRERIEDFYEELAYHWERSGDKEKTLEYLMKAGGKAARLYLNETAIDYYTRALRLAKDMGVSDDRLAEVYEARGLVYSNIFFHEESISDMTAAAELYTRGVKRAGVYRFLSYTFAWYTDDNEEAIRYARRMMDEIDPEDSSYDAISVYGDAAYMLVSRRIIDAEEGEKLLLKAIAISEEMGYKDKLAVFYSLLDLLYWIMHLVMHLDADNERRRSAHEKALLYMPYLKPALADYASYCALLGVNVVGDERFHLHCEAFDAGIKSGNVWATFVASESLGTLYQGRGDIKKAVEVYEVGWRIGVQRWIFQNWLLNIARGLMEMYSSSGERGKLLDMMLQIVDSTLTLYRKPLVYPFICRRWNSTVEIIYRELHGVALDTYRELEGSLRRRLDESDSAGEGFFYHCQLALLAMVDDRRDDVIPHLIKVAELWDDAGSFAQRAPDRIGYVIHLMNVPLEQQLAASDMLRKVERFEDYGEALDSMRWILPAETLSRSVDWDHLDQIALTYLMSYSVLFLFNAWVEPARLYQRYGDESRLHALVGKVRKEMSHRLQQEGVTHLMLEPVELGETGAAELVEQFKQDPVTAGWEWVNPAGDCSYELGKEGYLQVIVPPNHDLWPGQNYRAPRLLRAISGDLTIETKISSGSEGKKLGGLLVWKDERNYARLDVASSSIWYEGCVYYGGIVAGKFIHPGVHPFEAEEAWLRLERKGDRFAGYVSRDGENWYRCGWADIPMEDLIQVGIHALSESPATSTRFEYFKIFRAE